MEKEPEIMNAIITRTMLGNEDHGILTLFLFLDFDGSTQGFGGYDIRQNAGTWIKRILEVVGVDNWDDLKGKTIRVKKYGYNDPIYGIGHIIKDKWFCPKEEIYQWNLKVPA